MNCDIRCEVYEATLQIKHCFGKSKNQRYSDLVGEMVCGVCTGVVFREGVGSK